MRGLIITLATGIVALFLDLFSKWAVFDLLDLRSRLAMDVLPPVLNFRLGWNEGINFGLLSGAPEVVRWGLVLVAVGVAVGVTIWAGRRNDVFTNVSAGLLAGGALGNGWDRFYFGAVRDFLNMSCCGINNPFVFNVADIAVFAGVFGLIYVLEIRKT